MVDFFKRRFIELLGLVFIFMGLFVAVSFITYNPYDPSFHIASNAVVQNLAGTPGAFISGYILSFIGLAAIILVLIPICWGWKLLRKSGMTKLWLRITMLTLSLPAFAGTSALVDLFFSIPESWPSNSFGGWIGSYLYSNISEFIGVWGFGTLTIAISIVTFFFASGFTVTQWRHVGKVAYGCIYNTFYVLSSLREKILYLIKTKEHKEKVKKGTKSNRKIISKKEKAEKQGEQVSMDLNMRDNYQIPPVDLLKLPPRRNKSGFSNSSLSQNAEMLESVLNDFGVKGTIVEVQPGPVVTLYILEPSPGTKSSRVIGLSDDISRSMSAVSARIAVVPGRNAIGIELPNDKREMVYFRELLESDGFKEAKFKLPLALGKNIGGEEVIIDLAKTPHLLVAGTTGSGKSVALNTMILSLLYKFSPEECKFIMVDPKMLELSVYEDIPHLLTPVVTDPSKAVVALKWTVKEMENRYRLMANLGVRNIENYNQKVKEAVKKDEELTRSVQTGFDVETGKPTFEDIPLDMSPLPFIVVIVDEMADLMLVGGKDIEVSVQRLAQMARAAGIHIILATQRPSVDIITGVIKANFPTRISFQVTSKIDSRTILGEQGAEQLLGMGDMLYMAGGRRTTRIHGPFVDDKEVEKVVSFLKKQGTPSYIEEVTISEDDGLVADDSPKDELYDNAVSIVLQDGKASTSYVQRALKIGYNRAANIIEQMEKDGIISPADHVGRREVIAGKNK